MQVRSRARARSAPGHVLASLVSPPWPPTLHSAKSGLKVSCMHARRVTPLITRRDVPSASFERAWRATF